MPAPVSRPSDFAMREREICPHTIAGIPTNRPSRPVTSETMASGSVDGARSGGGGGATGADVDTGLGGTAGGCAAPNADGKASFTDFHSGQPDVQQRSVAFSRPS